MKKAFRFDLNLCTGCHACVLACANENNLTPESNWRQVCFFNEGRHPRLPRLYLSLACNHCQEPACLENCPAGVYRMDAETGAVTVDQKRCLGCEYCTWVCPYDAPKYNKALGVIEKCTFCNERLLEGKDPACVACCPTGALQLAERKEDAGMPDVPGFSRTGIKPAIEFVPLRGERPFPECSSPPAAGAVARLYPQALPRPVKKISLRSEWALLIFTTLAALLTALWSSSLVRSFRLNTLFFLGSGVVAMFLSTVHLGRKWRAWRAISNWRHSWLSLEIGTFSAFLGLTGIYMIFFPEKKWLGWTAAAVGFSALFVIDRVYRAVTRVDFSGLHSGQALWSGLYFTGILTMQPLLFCGAGLLKLLFYLERKVRFMRSHRPVRPWVSLLRLGCGFFLPFLILFMQGKFSGFYGYAVGLVILGDLIDRGEFYQEMEVMTPLWQVRLDLEKALRQLKEV